MTGLAKLLAAQRAQKGLTDAKPATDSIVDGPQPPADAGSPVDQDSPASSDIPSSDADAATQAEPKPVPTGLGGRMGLLKRAANTGAGGPAPSSGVQGVASSGVPADSDGGILGSPEFSLDDLAGFDETVVPVVEREGSGFPDEIEATAPDRNLPDDLTASQLSFVESLDGIYQVLNDPEMFGQSVRIIMMELQENPEYKRLISDQDVHTMIRAMRNTMGLAKIKKQEKSRKTTTTSRAKKSQIDDKHMAMLDSLLGGDLDD